MAGKTRAATGIKLKLQIFLSLPPESKAGGAILIYDFGLIFEIS
jgi:hypothetical protein